MSSDLGLKSRIWRLLQADSCFEAEFVRSLPVSPILCRMLINRGIESVPQAQRFLKPDIDDLHDPFLMDGLDLAVMRTRRALDRGEKIMVHGDYDVDGVTATALLVRVLRILKADVSWYVPHRQREGYGIGLPAIEAAKERGVGLIITVDCGTSDVEAVEHAKTVGIDVIVTDHHEAGAELAPALALINPRKPGCPYPFKELAGVGVAFKFAEALVRECGYDVSTFRRRFCDLAAIGTVGDIVPLLDENRTLVKFGMEELARTGKKGLAALLDIAGVSGSPITSYTLAYILAPRLNAAGRLDDASAALELILTTDDQEARDLAGALEIQNKERQIEQERITKEAIEQIASQGLDEKAKIFVLASQSWHPGIVGIVASKIMEQYGKPAILFALDENGETGTGSARSIGAFHLLEALIRCDHLLDRYGGHARAAGLSISVEKLREFDAEINRIADEALSESDLVPELEIDTAVELDAVTLDLARELQLFEPYGHCNREPVFLTERVMILDKIKMGRGGAHLKLRLGAGSGESVECVAFSWGDSAEAFKLGTLVDVCYNIRVNQFGGRETVQAVLCDARASDAVISEPFLNPGVA
jgi:single-stranded-DNA-specific exonuclease